MRKVTIHSDGAGPGTSVSVDGVELPNIDEVTVKFTPGGVVRVTIVLNDVALDLDGQVALNFRGPA